MTQRTGIDIIEEHLTRASSGGPNGAPIEYDENESKAYLRGLCDAYVHSLEMLNSESLNNMIKGTDWGGILESLDRCIYKRWDDEYPFQHTANQDARLALYEITKVVSFLKKL